MRSFCSRLVCAVVTLCLAASCASAVLTSVNPGEVFIASEVVRPGHIVSFAFQLNPEYLLPVTVTERDSGAVLHEWKDSASGAINIPASDKKRVLKFSFNNVDSVLTSIYVNFDIHVVLDEQYKVDEEQLDPIEKKVRALFGKVQSVRALQQTMSYQQKDHRATVEDVNERVLLWSILQVMGFVVVSGAQLYLLRLFLEKRRTV
jgi:p24 family protein beta-1